MAGLQNQATVFGQDFRETSTVKEQVLGARGETIDGKKYRYGQANASTALVAGKLNIVPDPEANHVNRAVSAAYAAGSKSITVDLGATAAAENLYQDGYMVVRDVDGEGIAYLIANHAAVVSDASITVNLAEPIKVALTTSSEVSFIKNPYKLVEISATDQLDTPAGVANVGVATSSYGWLQTGGAAAVYGDETFARGVSLTIGTNTAGEVEMLDAAGEPFVGNAIQAGIDGESGLVDLKLD